MADLRADLELDVAGALRQVDQLERRVDSIGGRIDVDASGLSAAAGEADRLGAEMEEAGDEIERAEGASKQMGAALKGALVGIGVAGALKGLKSLADAASDLEESSSKAQTVFGDNFEQIAESAENSATAVGLAEDQYLDATGTLGNLFTAQGLAGDAAADMSQDVVQLAADVASFNNLELEDSLDKLRAGLLGETEPLKSIGIAFSAAEVEARAFEMGLQDANGELSEGAKIQARYALIMDQTTTLQGDFARTSEGLANQQRILNAEWRNAQAALGQALLPAATELVGIIREDALPSFTRLAEEVLPLVVEAFEAFSPMLGLTFDLLSALAPVLGLVVDLIELVPDPLLQAAAAGFALNRAMGPMGGAIESVTRSMGGMRGATLNLSGALRGLAFGAAGLAIMDLVNQFGEGGAAADEFAAELEEAGIRGEEALEALRDRQSDVFEDIKAMRIGPDPLGLLNVRGVARAAGEWLGLRDAIGEAADAGLEFDPGREIEQRLPALAEHLDMTTDEVLRLAEAAGIDLAQGMLPDAIIALEDARAASDEFGDAQDDAAAATDNLTQKLNDNLNAARALADPVFALFRAVSEYEDAQKAANEAIAKHGANSREAQDASVDLAEALFGVQGAALEANVDVDQMRFQLLRWVEQGRISEEVADVLASLFEEMAGRAQDFSGDYHASFGTSGIDQTLNDLADLRAAIAAVPSRINVQVTSPRTGRTVSPGGIPVGAAHGDIFEPRQGGHIIRVAEAGQREMVVPLERPRRADQLLDQAGIGRSMSFQFDQTIVAPDPQTAGRRSAQEVRDAVYRQTGAWL